MSTTGGSSVTIKMSSPNRATRAQKARVVDKKAEIPATSNPRATPRRKASKKKRAASSKNQKSEAVSSGSDLKSAADIVSTKLSSAFDSLAGLAEGLLYPPDKSKSSKSGLLTRVALSKSESSSLYGMSPPPPNLIEGAGSDTTTFSPDVHRPIPLSSARVRTSSPVYTDPDDDTETERKSPMARMREESTVPTKAAVVTPPRTSDDILADKHRKWRRQMRLVHEQRKRKSRQGALCDINANAQSMGFLTHLIRETEAAACGRMEDSESFDGYSSEESESDSETDSSEDFSDEETMSPSPLRKKIRRQRHKPPVSAPSSAPTDNKTSNEKAENVKTPEDEGKPEETVLNESDKAKQAADITDKNFVKSFIADMSNDGFSLIWHQAHHESRSRIQPFKVKALLKMGSPRTDGCFEGPRLVWNPLGDAVSGGSVDLFDIRSVEKASPLLLQQYPFAMPGNSFFVRMNTGCEFVFEANNDGEARRFIHGLRWVVARLAFNLIIGNQDVSCELLAVQDDPANEEPNPSLAQRSIEAKQLTAMDDVTSILVDKSVVATD